MKIKTPVVVYPNTPTNPPLMIDGDITPATEIVSNTCVVRIIVPKIPRRKDKNPIRNKQENTEFLFLKTKKEDINNTTSNNNRNMCI